MSDPARSVLSAAEAARVIYNTQEPTEEQLNRVRYKIARGVLKGAAEAGRWQTTAESVAQYMAVRAVQKKPGSPSRHPQSTPTSQGKLAAAHRSASSPRLMSSPVLSHLYRDLLRDYVLAVVARRKRANQSVLFGRAVLAGQVACLLAIGGVLVSGYRMAWQPAPAEHAVVEQWIAENEGEFTILEWHPVQADVQGGSKVRVSYRYQASKRKAVTTDRIFHLAGGQVKRVAYSE